LNEFINYSRPREVRRAATDLNAVVGEVARALNYDIEEKSIQLAGPGCRTAHHRGRRTAAAPGAVQPRAQRRPGRPAKGEIRIRASRRNNEEAFIEISDNGPGVPPETARRFSNPISPPTRKAPAWAWPSSSRSCWRTAGKSNACPTSLGRALSHFPRQALQKD
jgi:nitrogen fixation/metabolism regulation signal transduction histidine kinase